MASTMRGVAVPSWFAEIGERKRTNPKMNSQFDSTFIVDTNRSLPVAALIPVPALLARLVCP
jgi:hypothetical protein